MKKIFLLLAIAGMFMMSMTSCSENYSNGDRVGTLTKFSEKGLIVKTWEGELNITQTGMNTSGAPFAFSMDKDKEDSQTELKATLDSAVIYGWKIKMTYHEVTGWNWFQNRGETDCFITDVEVLSKTFSDKLDFSPDKGGKVTGKVIDTVYVVIVDKSKIIK